MARSWAELLGDDEGVQETEQERAGFFGRLRDSLGKSRRALTDQLDAAAFDPADDEAWERLEEALIAADVGVPATAVLVGGVNGTGKTTTIGKLAHHLNEHGRSVIVAAADTFRAAAEEQLEIWAG